MYRSTNRSTSLNQFRNHHKNKIHHHQPTVYTCIHVNLTSHSPTKRRGVSPNCMRPPAQTKRRAERKKNHEAVCTRRASAGDFNLAARHSCVSNLVASTSCDANWFYFRLQRGCATGVPWRARRMECALSWGIMRKRVPVPIRLMGFARWFLAIVEDLTGLCGSATCFVMLFVM